MLLSVCPGQGSLCTDHIPLQAGTQSPSESTAKGNVSLHYGRFSRLDICGPRRSIQLLRGEKPKAWRLEREHPITSASIMDLPDRDEGAADPARPLPESYLTYFVPVATGFNPAVALQPGQELVRGKLANVKQRDKLFFGTALAYCSRAAVSSCSSPGCPQMRPSTFT